MLIIDKFSTTPAPDTVSGSSPASMTTADNKVEEFLDNHQIDSRLCTSFCQSVGGVLDCT